MAESENKLESNQDEPDQAISSSNNNEEEVCIAVEIMGSAANDSEAEASSDAKENSDLDETTLIALSSKQDAFV
ncbi:hypothetical protein GJ744_007606 [Endocarpon pusillum]|uniref:Uncharacterized protein n=1 Tax=Endocarpon pusillum TaxID=364733 RepID=A0A8H7DXV7_9EURO|nr:hypothetical protein GJ744_007606 [Endocarpon pusillum]